jgi:type VI secretion system protein
MHLRLVCGSETRTLKEGKLVLGAAGDCDWVLENDYISGRHCRIERAGDAFILTDTSRNGVYLNGSESRIPGGTATLADGDTIRIGTLEIRIGLESDHPPAPAVSPPRAPDARSHADLPPILPRAAPASTSTGTASPPPRSEATPARPSDGPAPRTGGSVRKQQSDPGAHGRKTTIRLSSVMGDGSALDTPMPPTFKESRKHSRDVSTSLKRLADLLDEFDMDLPAPASQPAPPPAAPPGQPSAAPPASMPAQAPHVPSSGGETELLRAYLEGAGVALSPDDVGDPAAMLRQQGELMRQLLHGVLSLLALRNQVKREFRVPTTQLEPVENNPLKFAGSAARAAEAMMKPAEPGFLPPTKAAADVFEDIIRHEAAMTGAARDALFAVIETLAPGAIDDSMKSRGWSLSRDAALWKRYKEVFAAATERGEESALIRQFRHEFSQAYIRHFRD